MQSWQVLPIVLVVGAFAASFAMRGKLRAKAAAMYSGALDALRAELAPDEAGAIMVVATHRKMLSATIYYVAVTSRRVLLKPAGGATQAFDRRAVQLAIKQKTFHDVGNMQTTISHGWELTVGLPDGARQAWRVYDHAEGIPDHGAHVRALVAALGG